MNRALAVVLVAWCGGAARGESVDLSTAMQQTRQDIEAAVAELKVVKDEIAARRVPLAADHRERKGEVARLRERLQRVLQNQQRGAAELERLQMEVRESEAELQYVETSLLEFRRSVGARRGIAETRHMGPTLDRIDAGWELDRSYLELPAVAKGLLSLARSRDRAMQNGDLFPGVCLDEEGSERQGMFVLFGPLGYFATDGEGPAGVVTTLPGSAYPSLRATPASAEAIRAVARGEESMVPVDVTGGSALKIASSNLSVAEQFRAGGFVMVPLGAVAALALLLAGWKFYSLAGIRTDAGEAIRRILAQLNRGEIEKAHAAAHGATLPLASILDAGIEYRSVPREHLEDILHERVLSSIPSLDRHLGMLAVLGAVAPLLGLLGTVTGMIHTFQLVSLFGSGDATLLSGGISEALITTKFGLIIAVPVLLVHAYLSRRVRTIVDALEHTALRFVNQLAMVRGEDL